MVVDRSNGVFDEKFVSVTANEDTVRGQLPCPILRGSRGHRVQDGFPGNRIHDSKGLAHQSPGGFLEQPARHSFCYRIEKGDIARSISADHRIANAVERDLSTFLLNE